MARVSGHVALVKRKRGDQWYVRYRFPSGRKVQRKLGPAWTGKGRPPAGYYTKRTAEAELHAILTDIRRGEAPDPGERSGRTFGDAVAEWLRYVEHDKARKASTLRDYRNTAYGRLVPEFGEQTPLEQITAERIDAYRRRLLAEGEVSRRTVQKSLVLLHGILKRAKALKWIPTNPADDVERVNLTRSGEFNVLTVEQVEAIAREARGMFGPAILVAAYTGLRTGELRALRWRDVDFAAATIHVRRNLPAGGEESAPKSGRVRSVPLIDDAARALDGLSRREHFTEPDDRVFAGETGGAVSEDAFRHALYEAMEAAGIDREGFPAGPFRFHDLRHTFGTLAVQVFPLVDVQAYMGHADIQTTMRYAHHVPKHDAARRFSEAIREARESVYRNVYRTAENQAKLSATKDAENRLNKPTTPV
jgi:integrase